MPQMQNQEIINQLEDIKERVINLERALIEEEEPTREEIEAFKAMEKEKQDGKLIDFQSQS